MEKIGKIHILKGWQSQKAFFKMQNLKKKKKKNQKDLKYWHICCVDIVGKCVMPVETASAKNLKQEHTCYVWEKREDRLPGEEKMTGRTENNDRKLKNELHKVC